MNRHALTYSLLAFFVLGAAFFFPAQNLFNPPRKPAPPVEGSDEDGTIINKDRSYFGVLRVQRDEGVRRDEEGKEPDPTDAGKFRRLMHGPTEPGVKIEPTDKDFRRLATTYYHRFGPAGEIMKKLYSADSADAFGSPAIPHHVLDKAVVEEYIQRLVFSEIAPHAIGVALGPDPLMQLFALWQEPQPVIGLGGTMASYGRPFQHLHYYEIDNLIHKVSLPGIDPELQSVYQAFRGTLHCMGLDRATPYFLYLQGKAPFSDGRLLGNYTLPTMEGDEIQGVLRNFQGTLRSLGTQRDPYRLLLPYIETEKR